ncbi:HK97-gp10 family putative phage morphogenesis protein [Novosphingobium gossypii]|uniref:HK97-gp10 family putative phage morphogenesis protein n=1 Tax=Novosphingobium gossypii TaxID=1604774 RepID=UPI003D1C806B
MAEDIFDFQISSNVLESLEDLKKATERTLLRRMAMQALEPMRDEAKRLAPRHEGYLRDSIVIGTNLTAGAAAEMREQPSGGVRVFMGTANRKAIPLEFGSIRARAFPFMRPAFQTKVQAAINFVIDNLETEIVKTAERAAKRAAKRV